MMSERTPNLASWDAATVDAIVNAIGAQAIVAPDDAAPMLEEWRGRWRGRPAVAVAPRDTEAVANLVKLCAMRGLKITPQGGNTGLVGGQTPTEGEVLLSLKRLNKIRDVSPLDDAMVVEAGVTLAEAQEAAAAQGRLFPLSIGSEGTCQIGGVLSTNAGGVNVLRYGNMRDLVLGVEAVLPDGEIWHGLRRLRKNNTGYDLKHLFIGAEGTLGIVTAAAVKLFAQPREKTTTLVGLKDPAAAIRLLARAQEKSGGQTTSFEIFSRAALCLVLKNIPDTKDPFDGGHPWYALVEFSIGLEGALAPMIEAWLSDAIEAGDAIDAVLPASDAQTQALWHLRHAMSEAMKPEGVQAKHDVSVPIASVPAFLDEADAAVEKVSPGARPIAFGHAGDGNIHYDVLEPIGGIADHFSDAEAWRDALEAAVYDVIDKYDGSISAEHGIGLARRTAMAARKSPVELQMMRAVKAALDPTNIMNPGKML